MASSTQNQQHIPNLYGATAAPPPTPSTQPNHLSISHSADELSRLLHLLPPTLSLPTRFSRSTAAAAATSPPLISLSNQNLNLLDDLLSSSSQLGFFQLTNHRIPSQLALSAESDSLSLFNLDRDQKQQYFPRNWPLGFEDDDGGDGIGESFCLDASCSTESTTGLPLTSLRELTRAMEKIGLEVIESLSCAVGFDNPFREDPTRISSLMWLSEGSPRAISGRFYPYVVGLQYQIRCQKYLLLADSGWVSVSPPVDSVMVTLGDIAQVWSNGKLKKVRGRPVANMGDGNNSHCISMTVLVTLPIDSNVSALLPKTAVGANEDEVNNDERQTDEAINKREERVFNSFAFEDYAWRVYHERLHFKDPLDRYRMSASSLVLL